jgi:ChpA-C
MKLSAYKVAGAGLIAGLGILSIGASPANADDPVTGPQLAESSASGSGVLTGNSVAAPIAVPVEICGNAVGVGVAGAGEALGLCEIPGVKGMAGDPSMPTQTAQAEAKGNGVGSGNAIAAPISIPIEICGNAVGGGVAGIGLAAAACDISELPDVPMPK